MFKCILILALAIAALQVATATSKGYADPHKNGGKMITDSKEPVNVIIVGSSDKSLLTNDGFNKYAKSINFDVGSFFVELGGKQKLNLGDGKGSRDQKGLRRAGQMLKESLHGGNHFRYWIQNGPEANTSAIFIAASVESAKRKKGNVQHDIVPDGYNMGRDQLVGNATSKPTSFQGTKFETKLLSMDTSLVKPNERKNLNHGINCDGKVAILRVTVSKSDSNSHNESPDKSDNGATINLSSVTVLFALGITVSTFLLF